MKETIHHKSRAGRNIKKFVFLLIALALFLGLKAGHAEEIRFYISAPTTVGVGEQFRVTFTSNTAGKDFHGPTFKGFSVLSGPNQSSSSNIQFINGSMTQSISYTFTYILTTDKEGTYEIGSATFNIGGQNFKSQPVKIQVVKGNAARSQGGNVQQGRRGQQGSSQGNTGGNNAAISANDLFVKTIVSKPEAYQGEQILVTQKIYSRVSLVGFEDIKYPAFSGFWSSEVKMPEQISLKKENVNGVMYNVAELKKTILFAQKSGNLTLEPISVTAVVQVRTQGRARTGDPMFDNFFNDPFFGSSVQNVKKEVKSAPVTIKIKPLPSNGQPADFNGSVGTFSIKASVDKQELKANDAINYKVSLSGSGNLELIDKLNVKFPSDFEVYDPKITKNIAASAGGVSGTMTFEYLVIPRNPGKFRIEPVTFSFFDLAKKSYVNLSTSDFTINVGKGDGTSVTYAGMNKEDIKYLGSDIRFVKTGNPLLTLIGYSFFNTWLFWLLVIIPPALFTMVMIIWRRRVRLLSDKSLLKNRKATSVAQKRLKKAGEHLRKKEEEVFYIEISQALWGYLSDKLYIPPASLSAETAEEALLKGKIPEELVRQYLDTIRNCEFARFAPGQKEEKMETLYQQAMKVITATEKELK
ncbi:MAG: BatD family protein [Bacteroidetes bacterium]|nr:BatD family protein [Bacteroidota bacterium]